MNNTHIFRIKNNKLSKKNKIFEIKLILTKFKKLKKSKLINYLFIY